MSVMYVTTHFSWQEFSCHDGTDVPEELKPNVRRLCNSLELVREKFRAPLTVISGYRTVAYNKRVGGAAKSQHCDGTGADLRPIELSKVSALAGLVEDMIRNGELPDIGGFGIYKNWIHLDIRPRKANGSLYRWTGKGVGSEE